MLQANLLCRMTGLAAQIAVTKNSFVVVKHKLLSVQVQGKGMPVPPLAEADVLWAAVW